MHIIHYTTLDELRTDAPVGATIYVCHQAATKTTHDNTGIPYRTTTVHAFARIAHTHAVLSYTPYVDQHTSMALPGFDEEQARHEEINRRAITVADQIQEYLQNAGYRTRRAIVDLHGAKPVQGKAWLHAEKPAPAAVT